MKFVDELIDIAAGDGGNGCGLFATKIQGIRWAQWWGWRAWGHVFAVADPNLNTLVDFRYPVAMRPSAVSTEWAPTCLVPLAKTSR